MNWIFEVSHDSFHPRIRCISSPREITHDRDGNMLSDGALSFTYDAANRLKTVSSNGVLLVTNFYDAKSRRVKKVTPEATTTFFYDGWNLIEERVAYTNGTSSTIHYYWGKDLSGTLQGAGSVGGLLYLAVSNSSTPNSSTQQLYIPCYDNNGNVTRYLDATGNIVAQYTYDAFGKAISATGAPANFFRHRFSTKYFDVETGLYYYGYRFYHPIIMSWISCDLAEEHGGMNLYAFCCNNPIDAFDSLGLTSVRINVGTESKDSGRGWLNFIKIDVMVVEPPEGDGKLNFIQLKKSATRDWQLDIQGTPGPYYYKLSDVKNYTQKDKTGKDIITLYDAPGGQLDNVDYFTAVVEVNRSCRVGKHPYGFSTINCYDKVKVVASVSWTFKPNETRHYKYSGKQDNYMKRMSMIPSMQQLINLSTWKTELCPSTRVEVTNGC